LVEARTQKTPNEIALTILLAALTVIFLLVCVTLKPFGIYSGVVFSVPVLIALLVCLIPHHRRLAERHRQSPAWTACSSATCCDERRAVEAAGDVDVLLLDKTGTITLGNRMASAFLPAPGVPVQRLADARSLLHSPTRLPKALHRRARKQQFNLRARGRRAARAVRAVHAQTA